MLERADEGFIGPDDKMRRNYEFHLKKVFTASTMFPTRPFTWIIRKWSPTRSPKRNASMRSGRPPRVTMASAVDTGLYRNRQSKAVHV